MTEREISQQSFVSDLPAGSSSAHLSGTDLPEANTLGELSVPLPEHKAEGRKRCRNTQERQKEKKAQKQQIEERS